MNGYLRQYSNYPYLVSDVDVPRCLAYLRAGWQFCQLAGRDWDRNFH